jgi:hypothetical protein
MQISTLVLPNQLASSTILCKARTIFVQPTSWSEAALLKQHAIGRKENPSQIADQSVNIAADYRKPIAKTRKASVNSTAQKPL